ncbi:MAG: S41 family peptidase [Acidobacteriota bacterium]|nr:MAG: S41 family peptidase [Acidobacteriota bacterium]
MGTRLGNFLIITIAISALLGGFFGDRVTAGATLEEDNKDLLKTFTSVFAMVQEKYATEIPSDTLMESAVRGMLRTLDPHSSFFSTRDYDRLQEEQKGKYYGLGISIRAESPGSGRVVVVEPPSPGTPAYKAGLRAGDVIAKIEGEPIDDWELNTEVIPNLKGPRGTTFNITVERPGEDEPLPFTVERDEIPMYTIKYVFRIRPTIGYVRITRFAETTGEELDEALKSLGENDLDGLILDLRDNPGGALSQALEVSDRFLDRGQSIVSTRSRTGRDDRDYKASRPQTIHYPMVVLINESSASASEIVAGALQDHDRALILGETSFGKALVQTIFPLEGSRGLALTTGKYYTPSERLIQRSYSESFWDYYNHRDEETSRDKDAYFTDGGRVVFGGGGITPDEEVKLERFSRPLRRVQRGNLFRLFASKVYSGNIEDAFMTENPPEKIEALSLKDREKLADQFVLSDQLYTRFLDFAQESDVELSADEIAANEVYFKNFLRQELLLLLVGDEASYKVALELDKQVQTAIDRIPLVENLLASSIGEAQRN